MTRIELEHYDYAAILYEDEAWGEVTCRDDFIEEVSEYAKAHDENFHDAWEITYQKWKDAGIGNIKGCYIRSDRLIEYDLSDDGDPRKFYVVLRREVYCP